MQHPSAERPGQVDSLCAINPHSPYVLPSFTGTTARRAALDAICNGVRHIERPTLHDFVRQSWPIIEPGREFSDGLHIQAICEHLEAVTFGSIKRLIINIPPRYGKSNLVSILWPCWEWTLYPYRRWMFCSYSSSLSVQHSQKRRRIITGEWYQHRWGNIVRLERDQNRQDEYENTRRGLMFATSTGGTTTGKGGDRLVGDDVLNPQTAESEAERKAAISYLDNVWMTRLDDKKTGAMVFVEQRLHSQDITAHLTKQGGWEVLTMPAQYGERTKFIMPMSKAEVVREPGDLLCPEREGHAELERMKLAMGTRAYQAQYLQAPSSEEGALLRRSWFRCYTAVHNELFRVWSWDTAFKEGNSNDYSVGTYWSATTDGYCLLAMFRDRVAYPVLRREVQERYQAMPSAAVLIEDAASGQSLIQDLASTRIPVIPVKADKDKVLRVNLQAPVIEAGQVYLPEVAMAPWVVGFRDELCEFPYAPHDDQVDSAMMALAYMRSRLGSGRPASGYGGDGGAPWKATTRRTPDWA